MNKRPGRRDIGLWWLLGFRPIVTGRTNGRGGMVIDVITDQDLRALVAIEAPHCVSLYLPTPSSGSVVAEGPIRLKNLVAAARNELETRGMRKSDAEDLLGPVESMVDDTRFWARSTQGLAIFATPQDVRRFRLGGPVQEAVAVADRYWIAPLIPFVTSGAVFYVLALSDNQVRLLRGHQYEATELDPGTIPASKDDALGFDDREAQLHSHGADRVGPGDVSATFHGHGGAKEFDDVDQTRFLRAVDRGLAVVVGDKTAPLVLAGVEEIVSRFRKISRHTNIVESFVAGNPERLSSAELHERALPLVASYFDVDLRRVLEVFGSPSTPTVVSLPEAIDAAACGRVSELLILGGLRVWGTYDRETRKVDEHADRRTGDCDLIDLAARETLAHGGVVFAVDPMQLPPAVPVAAVLRY